VGSFLRKDHPLFAQRIRQAVAAAPRSSPERAHDDWAMPLARGRCAAAWAQALADVAGPWPAKGVAAPAPHWCRRGRGDGPGAAVGRAQGRPAGQCRGPASAGRHAAGAGQLDRRADRRHGRLPDRSRQHGGRATGGGQPPGRPERGPDAVPADEGAAAAEHRAGAGCGGRCRGPGRAGRPGWWSR
jgi:hypothetical protein